MIPKQVIAANEAYAASVNDKHNMSPSVILARCKEIAEQLFDALLDVGVDGKEARNIAVQWYARVTEPMSAETRTAGTA